MDLVIDANIFIAGLIRDSTTRRLIINSQINFHVPEIIIEEIYNNIDYIKEKSGLSIEDLRNLINNLIATAKIKIIPTNDLVSFLKQAIKISPHEKDIAYFALALKLKCGIWSNENLLKKQSKINIYSTKDLIEKYTLF